MSEYSPAPLPPPPPASGASGPRASFWQRLGAFVIDLLLVIVVSAAIRLALNDSLAGLIEFLVVVAYFSYFEGGATGQTLGKRVLGIRVYDFTRGGPIGYGRGVLRYFARILSTIAFLLGYFWMIWDKEKQCWHDKIATSVVVPVSDYPVKP